jgi:hypothetical protein
MIKIKENISNMIKKVFLALALVGVTSLGVASVTTFGSVQAATCNGSAVECARDGLDSTSNSNQTNLTDGFRIITNILLFLIGAISVIMLVIGGFRYVTSNGEASAVTSAKNTILYALIGVIVAILAYAAVDFVIDAF